MYGQIFIIQLVHGMGPRETTQKAQPVQRHLIKSGSIEIAHLFTLQLDIWSQNRHYILFQRTRLPRKICSPRHIFQADRFFTNVTDIALLSYFNTQNTAEVLIWSSNPCNIAVNLSFVCYNTLFNHNYIFESL